MTIDDLCARLDAAARLEAADPTSLDRRAATRKARAALARQVGGGDHVAECLKLWREEQRFEAEQARTLERQVVAELADGDDWRTRGCAGSFVSDAGGRL